MGEAQIIQAPTIPTTITGKHSIFLGGTITRTSGPDWRETLTAALAHLPVTIFNPFRPDWDSTWREDATSPQFQVQVEWEFYAQDLADVVVIYFGPGTDAPISLLELGLCARAGKALPIVVCHKEYRKRGYVEMACRQFHVVFFDADEYDWAGGVVRMVETLLG